MLQLTPDEAETMRSQFETANSKVADLRPQVGRSAVTVGYLPYAFTEHGALMAAGLPLPHSIFAPCSLLPAPRLHRTGRVGTEGGRP